MPRADAAPSAVLTWRRISPDPLPERETLMHLTHNRRMYVLRCWAIGVAMGAVNYTLQVLSPVRPDGFVPANNTFASFTVLVILWQGMDWLSQRRWGGGCAALLLPFLLTGGYFALLLSASPWRGTVYLLQATLLPLPLCTEGGCPSWSAGSSSTACAAPGRCRWRYLSGLTCCGISMRRG